MKSGQKIWVGPSPPSFGQNPKEQLLFCEAFPKVTNQKTRASCRSRVCKDTWALELYQRYSWGGELLPCYVSLSPAGIWSHVLKHELSIGGRGKIKVTKHMEIDVRRGFLYLDFHMFHDKAKKNTACKLMRVRVWVKFRWLCGWVCGQRKVKKHKDFHLGGFTKVS